MRNILKEYDHRKIYPLLFTVIFILVLLQYSFSSIESIFYDFWIRHDFNHSYEDNIVVVTLDEESDDFLGESYPYSFSGHEKFIKKLLDDSPAVINYFVNFETPESGADKTALNFFKNHVIEFKKNKGKFRFGTDMDSWGEQVPPLELRDFGHSLALLNVDNATFSKDDVSRRAILNISGENTLHLWTANEFRKKKSLRPLDSSSVHGHYYLEEADATFTMFRYYTSPIPKKSRIKIIPFHRVMIGNFPKGFFSDKIVLVGPSYLSNPNDFIFTPFNKESYTASKMMLHAQIIQSLIRNKTIYQVPRKYSMVLAVLFAIILSLIISRIRPTKGLFITSVMMPAIFLIAYLLFTIFGVWIYITHIVFTIFVVYYIWVPFRTIGEYQRRFAIQEETKLLKKVEDLKQNFISLMSHDLKTPVAKIAGITDNLIQENKNNPGVKSRLETIIDSTKELNKFISSILDLTKIESQDLEIKKSSKDVNTILESIVDGLKFEASNQLIDIECKLGPLYPITIDTVLIKRVFSNLIENAIKYSGKGSQVLIKSWDDEAWVYVQIVDTGVGIDPNDIENIFEKFYRIKNDASHTIKGTGLGLYLVKYFVELHGGEISVSSTLGEGTVFTVKLKNE